MRLPGAVLLIGAVLNFVPLLKPIITPFSLGEAYRHLVGLLPFRPQGIGISAFGAAAVF
jgi:hypothetical protein